jgi:hypothetical protein
MLADPCPAFELGVITGASIFMAWMLSPPQRSRRRRQDARNRIAIRRALAEPITHYSPYPMPRGRRGGGR